MRAGSRIGRIAKLARIQAAIGQCAAPTDALKDFLTLLSSMPREELCRLHEWRLSNGEFGDYFGPSKVMNK